MPRKSKASQSSATSKSTRTRANKRDKPPDEDDDWSMPSELELTSRPEKKLHYSLDTLLQEKANAPPSPPKREEESDEEEKDKDVQMTEAEKEEGIDLLSREGFAKTEQVREILHFDDELKKLDQFLDLLRRPYIPQPMVPSFATPKSPRVKGLKRQNSAGLEDAHEQALKTICHILAEESPAEIADIASENDNESESDFPYLETPVEIAADGITLDALLQPINDFLQKNDAWSVGTTQYTTCREIIAWLLSLVAYHPHTIIAGSIFSLFSRLLLGANTSLRFIPGISSSYSLSPSFHSLPRPRSCSFWANILTPTAFYQIWRAYGVDFVGIDTTKEEEEDPFFSTSPSISSTPSTSSASSSTTTTTTSTTSTSETPTSEEPSSSPAPKSKGKKATTKSKKGKGKNSAKEVEEKKELKKPATEKQPPKPPIFPDYNFILVTQLLQMCTELSPTSFPKDAMRKLINQTFQFMLDAKTRNAPSLIHLFESLLFSYLQLPPAHKRNTAYTDAQQQLLRDLCEDIAGASDSHRVWVRAVETIPITSTPCVHLRILLALKFLHSLSSSFLLPPLPSSQATPSPFSLSYISDLPSFLRAVLEGEYQDDAVLLSVVQLLQLCLGPELGPTKNRHKEFEKLITALQNMNKRVKDAGLFGLIRTRAKDHLVFMIGILSVSDGKKERMDA